MAQDFEFVPKLRALTRAVCAAGLLLLVGFFAPYGAHALAVPALQGRVNDYAQLLPEDRRAALEARLAAYEQRTQQQFALLTIPSLEGDDLEQFSIRVAESWKLGKKGNDQGLIVLVAVRERKARIEVGYGLEGVVPDAVAARIVRNVMAPAFGKGDFAGGIDAAFSLLMQIAAGEGSPAPQAPRSHGFPIGLLLFVVFALFPLLSRFGGRRRGLGGVWIPPFWSGGGGFGGGGGGGGGGFRGGGGGFGGGGASGGW